MSFPIKQHVLLRESRRPRVWTVEFTPNLADAARVDAAGGMVVTAAVGDGIVRNDFDRVSIFQRPIFNATWDRTERRWIHPVPLGAEGFSWSPTEPYREVVYRCQPFWYKLEFYAYYNIPRRISVTDRPMEGYTLAPMFKNGRDFVYRPCFEMGLGEDGLPHSRAGLTPCQGTLTDLMQHARNYDGAGRTEGVYDWFSDFLLQIVEFGTWEFSKFMAGNKSGAITKTGSGLLTARSSLAQSAANDACAWRGKENPWKNVCSGLCDVFIHERFVNSEKYAEVSYLADMSLFDGTQNEHYSPVGAFMMTGTGAGDVSCLGYSQGFLFPTKKRVGDKIVKCGVYMYADYYNDYPVAVAVGGNSTAALLPLSYITSPLNWEAADLKNSRATQFGARLVLDEGIAR